MRLSSQQLLTLLALSAGVPAFAGDAAKRKPLPAAAPIAAPVVDDDAIPGIDESDAILGRIKWLREGRVGPDGRFPPNARLKAYNEIEENIEKGLLQRASTALPGSIWSPIGPAPASGNTGRVTAIAIDPTDSNTVYVAGATGGIWKTVNAGGAWTPLTDQQASLAIGAIAIAPSDRNTIYAGTGEANASCDSYYGAGILKSIDGGANWTLLGNATFNGYSISRVVVHPTDPLTAWISVTTGVNGSFICAGGGGGGNIGFWKTTNGGTSWTKGTGTTGSGDRVIIDPANSSILYGVIKNSGVYKSVDSGASWSLLAGGLPTPANVRRGDVAIRASDGNLFAIFESTASGIQGIYRSIDAGVTWTPTPAAPATASLCNGYCWYFIGIEVAPDGAVWVRGFNDFRSADNGATWPSVTGSVHVDHHAIAFGTASTVAWVGSDGGAYRSANIAAPSWTGVNTGLQIMQFYPGASVHPGNGNYVIGGAQDNGTNRYTGTTTWTQIFGGDGAWTTIDQSNPNVIFASYQYLMVQRSLNGGSSFSQTINGLTDSNTANAPFIAPFEMCPNNDQHLIAGTITVWKTTNQATLWAADSPASMAGGGKFNALAWAKSDAACNTYFAGSTNGQVWRTTVGGGTAAANWSNISTGLPGRGIQDFAVLPSDGNTVYVGLSGYSANVWKTTNALGASPSWSSVSTGLPNVPVNAVLIDPTDATGNTVYIGTDTGVFRSQNGGANWAAFSTGLPKTPVFDLVANPNYNLLVAFTHGRGAWRLIGTAPGEAGITPPLKLTKINGGLDVAFDWGAPGGTCGGFEGNVYRGNLATLATAGYTHSTVLKCQATATSYSLSLSDVRLTNSDYFIVTASNGAAEGSYGQNSSGTERPVSSAACRAVQSLAACP